MNYKPKYMIVYRTPFDGMSVVRLLPKNRKVQIGPYLVENNTMDSVWDSLSEARKIMREKYESFSSLFKTFKCRRRIGKDAITLSVWSFDRKQQKCVWEHAKWKIVRL